ncbi:MAG: hypothetical protein SGI88_18515 [Candidatus Hydrogenedentes bacterium]|nr:hypothetical protein [Candidatus Hydrogenedentota bacterium]
MSSQSTVKKALEKESLREQEFGYLDAEAAARVLAEERAKTWPDTGTDIQPKPRSRMVRWVLASVLVALILLAIGALWFAHAYFRENTAIINPAVQYERSVAVRDGLHNTNTDLIYWRGAFHLVHATAPAGLSAGESRLVLRRSTDTGDWETAAEFRASQGSGIRKASFAAVGSRLFLYAAMATAPFRESTFMSYTEDGNNWSALVEIAPIGTVVGRPKTRDGLTWYSAAHSPGTGVTTLLRTDDGLAWEEISEVYQGGAQEPEIEFLADGRMLVLVAVRTGGSPFSDRGHTVIATAFPPYTSWETNRVWNMPLESPCLFRYKGDIYAVAGIPLRANNRISNALGRRRTEIYRVQPGAIEWITDLPSGGDTAGAAIVVQGDQAFGSYYSSDVSRDWPQFLGEMLPTEIHSVEIDLTSLM